MPSTKPDWVGIDFAAVERRALAQFSPLLTTFDMFELLDISGEHKRAVYAACYGNSKPLNNLIDEEGCGAVIAACKQFV